MKQASADTIIQDRIPVSKAESLAKMIRLLARSGKKNFHKYLYQPLIAAGWEGGVTSESSSRIMRRIDQMQTDSSRIQSIPLLSKRMIASALREDFSRLGNSVLYFLEMIIRHGEVAASGEALNLIQVLQDPLREFEEVAREQTKKKFERDLEESSSQTIREAYSPVLLGRNKELVEVQEEARILFEKIKAANKRQDLNACRKLISAYLIKYAEEEQNNRDEIEKLIEAFESRESGFRKILHETMAINLYYQITKGISDANLKQTIRGIKKYAFIFQGNPDVPYHRDIDRLESYLYDIIRKKGLIKDLIKQTS